MKAYLVLDEFGYQVTIKGIFVNIVLAEACRDRAIKNFSVDLLAYAEKHLKDGNERYDIIVKDNVERQKRPAPKRWYWLDYTSVQYVKLYIITIKETEFNSDIDLNIYAE